ncbi:MAG: winged helix DNA-binding domain-containing protein [Acidimicrobiales bacterium]
MTDALRLRMRRQGLAGPLATDVVGAARAAGLQAQDLGASRLAVRARSRGLTLADVVRAVNEGTVVRTWLMRGTLHLVPAEDVRWLVALFGPLLVRRDRRRRLQLGLDDDLCERALAALPDVLAGGPLTRAELVHGLGLTLTGQAPAHLMAFAAASGVICRGPERGAEATYVLLDRWVPAGVAVDGGAVELARRYFASFAPATADDFVAWSGLPAGPARAAAEASGEPVPVTVEGEPAWRLLPAFDSYLVGYRSRAPALDPQYAARINAGGGWVHPAVVRNGRIVGTWRLRDKTVAVELFGTRPRGARAALEEEAADVGRFLGLEARLTIC